MNGWVDPKAMASDPNEDKHMHFIITNVIFIPVLLLTVAMRLWGRLHVVRAPLGWDDRLILVAMLFGLGFQISLMVAFTHGGGRHIMSLTPRELQYFLMVWYISGPLYMFSMGFIKLSILALYMRISANLTFRRTTQAIAAVVICLTVSNVLVMLFQCSPAPATWDVTIANKKCIDIGTFYLANAALNIATDIAVYVLPIRMLWKTQIPRSQKLGLCVIFGLGGIACVASGVKLVKLPKILENGDLTWFATTPLIWSVVEINVSVLGASLPAMKGLAKRYCPCLFGSLSSSGGSSSSRNKLGDTHTHEYSHNIELNKHKIETTVMSGMRDEEEGGDGRPSSQARIMVPQGGIMKTTELQVEVDVQEDGASERGLTTTSGGKGVGREFF